MVSFANFSKILRTGNPFSRSVNNVDLREEKKEERKERIGARKGEFEFAELQRRSLQRRIIEFRQFARSIFPFFSLQLLSVKKYEGIGEKRKRHFPRVRSRDSENLVVREEKDASTHRSRPLRWTVSLRKLHGEFSFSLSSLSSRLLPRNGRSQLKCRL